MPAYTPVPPPPPFLKRLPSNSDEYILGSQLIRNGKELAILRTPVDQLGPEVIYGWEHFHILLVAYLDDNQQRLCWHFRPVERLETPANTEYPGRTVYACHYYHSHPEVDCRYRELDFHYARRIRLRQPLVAPTESIVFPRGHAPFWKPPRRNNTRRQAITRRWRPPPEILDETPDRGIEDELVADQPGQPGQQDDQDDQDEDSDQEMSDSSDPPASPTPSEQEVIDVLDKAGSLVKDMMTSQPYNDRSKQQREAYANQSLVVHHLIQQISPPDQMSVVAFDALVTGRKARLPAVPDLAGQAAYAAAHQVKITEEKYQQETWKTRADKLISWFRHDGLAFALPFLRELLENTTFLSSDFHDECLRLLGPLGQPPDDADYPRPLDDGKADRMDDMLKFMRTSAYQPIQERNELPGKLSFLRDLLGLQQMHEAYAEHNIPWKTMINTADEIIQLIKAHMDASDFDINRMEPEAFGKGMALLQQALPANPELRPWSGTGDAFAPAW